MNAPAFEGDSVSMLAQFVVNPAFADGDELVVFVEPVEQITDCTTAFFRIHGFQMNDFLEHPGWFGCGASVVRCIVLIFACFIADGGLTPHITALSER